MIPICSTVLVAAMLINPPTCEVRHDLTIHLISVEARPGAKSCQIKFAVTNRGKDAISVRLNVIAAQLSNVTWWRFDSTDSYKLNANYPPGQLTDAFFRLTRIPPGKTALHQRSVPLHARSFRNAETDRTHATLPHGRYAVDYSGSVKIYHGDWEYCKVPIVSSNKVWHVVDD